MRLRNIPRAESVLGAHDKVIQDAAACRGNWRQVFAVSQPIHIEIGMGKGQFLLALARKNPGISYVGIERYSSVLLRAAERYEAEEEKPQNLRFICMDASKIEEVFAQGEVDRIYLNFSDPWPKKRHAGRRLTSAGFWQKYDRILAVEGTVEFKTDNRELFEFSLEQARETGWKLRACTWDLHGDAEMNRGNVMTEYEEKFSALGHPIHKLIAERTDKGNGRPA